MLLIKSSKTLRGIKRMIKAAAGACLRRGGFEKIMSVLNFRYAFYFNKRALRYVLYGDAAARGA